MLIGRRSVLAGAASLAATGALAAEKLEDTVVIRTTGGAFEKALTQYFFDPFTKATGTRVVPVATSYGDMIAKTAAMSKAGHVEWDIISPQFYQLPLLSPYLVNLGDCSVTPNVLKDGIPGICGRWGVQYLTGGVVLSWDVAAMKGHPPASWADFWNIGNFPGRRALPSYGDPWNNTLLFALMADGVPPNKLFPLDLGRAFRKLDQIKPHIDIWWKTGAQSIEMIRSGDIQMTALWSGTAYAAKRGGLNIDWTYHQAAADQGSWAILQNSPHPRAALAFLNFYMENPERHAAFSRAMGYATTNRYAAALLSPVEKHELVSSPEVLAQMAHVDGAWVKANGAKTLERWNQWLAS